MPRGHWTDALGGVVAAVTLGCVLAFATQAPDGGSPVGTLTVAAVQGGGERGLRKAEVAPSTVFAAQVAATARLPRPKNAGEGRTRRLVVWPEDVISLSRPLEGSATEIAMAAIARSLGATLVAGVTITVSDHAFRNEVVAWSPAGHIVGTVEKVHRVPFGEYVPDRGFFAHLANLSAVPLDAIAGHRTELLDTPAGRLGVLVSYEVFYPERSRSSVRAGAQLLVVPTNTSSYANGQVPAQEVAADEIQAVENGRSLVQASPTGYSTIVDASGHLVRHSRIGERAVVRGVVGMRAGQTLYVRFGDWPILAAALVALGAGWADELARRISRSSPNGYRRTGFPRSRTSHDSTGRLPSPVGGRSQTGAADAPRPA